MVRRNAAFTVFELLVVVAIVAIVAGFAATSWQRAQQTNKIKTMAREIAGAIELARSSAIQDEAVYGVYVNLGAGRNQDLCGTPLPANQPITVFLDSVNQNCCLDPGETQINLPADTAAANGLAWGATWAPFTVPTDQGTAAGNMAAGTSLPFLGGGAAPLLMFRQDGLPVMPNAVCTLGQVGSGTGAFYLTTNSAGPGAVVAPAAARDYAVVVSPLGATRIHTYNRSTGTWTN